MSEQILAAVETLGYECPTPIQEQAIPLVLAGRDVVAAAQTGTGKTAAFSLPLMQRIGAGAKGASPSALVVTPTRELAAQIDRVATEVAKHTGQSIATVVGGVKYGPQVAKMKSGVDVLVATPGRLIDLTERGDVDLSKIRVLVLDEADRMLDMGFWPSMRKILSFLPKDRQNLLFSATLTEEITQIVGRMLHDPAYVEIAVRGTTAANVEQAVLPVEQGQKPELLAALIRQRGADRVLVFTRTKARADLVKTILENDNFKVAVMHADRTQQQRDSALEKFREGKVDILVATDIIARGIDISDIDHVVNYDVPENPDDYVHRIGRTARAGASGYALTLLGPDEISQFREIEYLLGEHVPTLDIEGFVYRDGRIVPFPGRPVKKTGRSVFGGRVMRRGRR
ncbi:MAG TPA: DEAD/DEAH box helicase [Coriobacteriia bacterium]|nr:DEAD/DEAH box helicase [Coriobacteriia bacterium]